MPGTFKITEATSLALHAMAYLSKEPKKAQKTKEVAGRLHISENHLSKVLQRLAKAGLLKSMRGAKGGYALKKDPQNITLLNIYEVIEGPLRLNDCLMEEPICRGSKCILGEILTNTNKSTRDYLAATKIADLADIF